MIKGVPGMVMHGVVKKVYEHKGMEIQSRAVALFYVLLSLTAAGILLGGNSLLDELSLRGLSGFIFAGVTIFSLVLLLKGKYHISTNIALISSYLVVFYVNMSTNDPLPAHYLTSAIAYLSPIIVTAGVYAYARWQSVAMAAGALINLVIVFIFRTLPAYEAGLIASSPYYNLLASSVAPTLIGICIFIIQTNQIRTLKEVRTSEARARNNFSILSNALEELKEGLSTGKNLNESAIKTVQYIDKISTTLGEMIAKIESLSSQVRETETYQQKLLDEKENVRTKIHDQSAAVEESSASIGQMMVSIRSISKSAHTKGKLLQEITEMGKKGLHQLDEAMKSFKKIYQSSSNVLKVIDVIEGINDRTNLLAMNAAIEAAHAGAAGKGFSIVAAEIRKLAKETSENSRAVRGTLEKNALDIKMTSDINQKSINTLNEFLNKLEEIYETLQEIINGMTRLSGGTGEIIRTVENLKQTNTVVNDTLGDMTDMIDMSVTNISHVKNRSTELHEIIENINSFSGIIFEEAKLVSNIGMKNESNMLKLRDTLGVIT
jgi:methyl-accepting chemotaxis protein